MSCLIVFSQRRWAFVHRRQEQLMSRLARHHRVLFVEEPVFDSGAARLDVTAAAPNVDVIVARTPVASPGFHNDQIPVIEPMLVAYLRAAGIRDYIAWFYTPMAMPLLGGLAPRAVVYDCIGNFTTLGHPPPLLQQLQQHEAALLELADLVLAAGPTLYSAKRPCNDHVHCLPDSGDTAHFEPGRLDPANAEAGAAEQLHAGLPRPRLGYFGVIDRRIDLALVAALADAHPAWQLLLAGPVTKIDPATLPQRPNIHWLGVQPYARLPYLIALWDVCLLPFAVDAAAPLVSAARALEYMAAEKPVVSSAVPDVVALYGDTVRIGSRIDGSFLHACEQALGEPRRDRDRRIGAMLATVQGASWDRAADAVQQLLVATLARPRGRGPGPAAGAGAARSAPRPANPAPSDAS